MNTRELVQDVRHLGVAPESISLDRDVPDTWRVVARDDGAWLVHYCDERGRRLWESTHDDENSACFYLYGRLAHQQVMGMKLVLAE